MFLLIYQRHFYTLFTEKAQKYDSYFLVANCFGRDFHREKMFAFTDVQVFYNIYNFDSWWAV